MHASLAILRHALPAISIGLLSLIAVIGLIAVISPRWFRRLAAHGNHWVDTQQMLAVLDRRIDVDQYVLPYARPLGVAVLVAVAVITLKYFR